MGLLGRLLAGLMLTLLPAIGSAVLRANAGAEVGTVNLDFAFQLGLQDMADAYANRSDCSKPASQCRRPSKHRTL